uniref:Uncharacterized protein n=1 Tax=Arundo donax TaxID=35708 RepID=A0A0A9C4Y6_ARUDO
MDMRISSLDPCAGHGGARPRRAKVGLDLGVQRRAGSGEVWCPSSGGLRSASARWKTVGSTREAVRFGPSLAGSTWIGGASPRSGDSDGSSSGGSCLAPLFQALVLQHRDPASHLRICADRGPCGRIRAERGPCSQIQPFLRR